MVTKMSRFGSYGVVRLDNALLLSQKKSGPYKGRWGLPGGALEFGETPEESLAREILEETAYRATQFSLLDIATHNGLYETDKGVIDFHQVGIIYNVGHVEKVKSHVAEEKFRWAGFDELKEIELTPFAQSILHHIHGESK